MTAIVLPYPTKITKLSFILWLVKKVEIPGEREREHRLYSKEKIAVPIQTWKQIKTLIE